jgi:hypothetical protein
MARLITLPENGDLRTLGAIKPFFLYFVPVCEHLIILFG